MKTYLDTATRSGLDLSDEDLELTHALQVNGRASFKEIADVLGVSDQTVARRWSRLRTSGRLRILGLTDPPRLGESRWMVRARCTPDATASLGDALARRTDTTWVNLGSGGTEVSCSVRTHAPGADESLLLRKLPHTPQVVDVSAHCLLHVFFGHDLSPINKRGPLTAAQVAALTPPGIEPVRERAGGPQRLVTLDEADRHLLDLLARDGRTPAAELAAATGLSASTVRRRITELRAAGALYFDMEYHPDVLRQNFRSALWLEIAPSHLAEAGAALALHPEVAFAAAVTGTANLYANIDIPTAQHFYRYLTESIAALPGLRHTATNPIHRTLKGPGPYLPDIPART